MLWDGVPGGVRR